MGIYVAGTASTTEGCARIDGDRQAIRGHRPIQANCNRGGEQGESSYSESYLPAYTDGQDTPQYVGAPRIVASQYITHILDEYFLYNSLNVFIGTFIFGLGGSINYDRCGYSFYQEIRIGFIYCAIIWSSQRPFHLKIRGKLIENELSRREVSQMEQ